ncbi:MAG: phage/plasmid primase, P4 family [Isosphaeraceae bacterium]
MNVKPVSNAHAAALALRNRGYWSHATHPARKNPIGKAWGLARWPAEKINETFAAFPGAGVGIALGPARGPGGSWLVDLEVDGSEGGASLDTLLGGERPDTPSWSSARGDHALFTADGRRLQRLLTAADAKEGTDAAGKGSWHLDELPGLELRIGGYKDDGAVKQVQSVCPPTVGTDGKARAWTVTPHTAPAPLPEAAYAFLEGVAERKAIQAGEVAQEPRDGHPRGVRRDPAAYAGKALAAECDAVEREPAGGRNNRLNAAAFAMGTLVGAGALLRPEVERALAESARRAGLGDAEARETIRSGLDAGTTRPRDLSGVGNGRHPSSNGTGPHQNGDGHAEVAVKPARTPRTDTGNAERMVARFGDRIRYCHPWKKWLSHDGRRWALDDTPAVHQLAKKTARHILAEAAAIEDKARRAALVKWARESESRARLNSMIALAAVEEGIPILPEMLDVDPWLLNVETGTIDLRTGRLRPHRREDFITRLAPVAFDAGAACPLWDSVLLKVFGGNLDLIAFWDRLCGVALTGVTHEQILPILWGKGSNGKSTLVRTLVNLMGPDFAMIAPPGLLVARRGEAHPTERAILHGKRLVVEMETEEGVRLNENLIKHLTGGDSITARRMGEDFWSFDPTHKLMLCTNHKPEVKGTDHAIWRRPKLVPFTVTIPDSEAITDLADRLRVEYPGILARCVRGCLDWQRNGLRVPAEVTEATEGYRAEQDTLRAFLDEECVTGDSIRVKATPLYAKYRSVTEGRGETPMSQKSFGIAMADRGFERFTNNGTWYRGLGLRSSGPAESDSPY